MSSFTDILKYEFTGSYYHHRPLYVITEVFSYNFGSKEKPVAVITIPVGFVTDFASIPWPLSVLFKPDGPWAKAAVIHDWLCNDLSVSNIAKDSIFYEALGVLGIGKVVSFFLFLGVRIWHLFFDPKRNNSQWMKMRKA